MVMPIQATQQSVQPPARRIGDDSDAYQNQQNFQDLQQNHEELAVF
jgi:hypothetical protein